MKRKNLSIRTKLFSTFLIFAIVLLAVLWFFQVIYLDDFYKHIKKAETEYILNELETLVASGEDCSEVVEEIAASSNIAIFITDEAGNEIYNAEYIANSRMSSITYRLFNEFVEKAKENGGEAIIEFKGSQMQRPDLPFGDMDLIFDDDMSQNQDASDENNSSDSSPEDSESAEAATDNSGTKEIENDDSSEDNKSDSGGNNAGKLPYTEPKNKVPKHQASFMQNMGDEFAESVIYVRMVEVEGKTYILMVNSVLTPLDATVSTLKSELSIISLVLIVISLLFAFFISRIISKSIIRTNEGAKRLAKGDYSVTFNSTDYKEIAQLSDTLNYAARELGKTDQLQKELIANVSHDLRTPLTMIKGYSEVMRDIPGENTPENVQAIIEETERLTGLVNDMLDISKLKAGTIELKPELYNITDSIKNVLARYNKLREVEGYTIDFEYEDEVEIYADEQKMYQVLYNLINNAINYTGEDKTVYVVQKRQGNTLRIEVTDTGNGVSQEDIPYVWDRYYKDKSNHVRAKAGTGLGLSIVKNVLELHGARYGVSSIVGQGATFWFEIAIDPSEEEDDN